jgi:hypothetical protein
VKRYALAAARRQGFAADAAAVEDVAGQALLAAVLSWFKYDAERSSMDQQHFMRLRASYAAKEAAARESRRRSREQQLHAAGELVYE